MSWLNADHRGRAKRHPDPPPEIHPKSEQAKIKVKIKADESNELDTGPPTNPADGLQLIVIAGSSSVAPLSFRPDVST